MTSAIREAVNGLEVLERIRESTGVELQVLTGEEEARLTFLAVRRWFGWSAGRLLVLDIGGGSLELASGIDEDPDVALSVPLGAGRLTRRFLPAAHDGDRPDLSALDELDDHAEDLLHPGRQASCARPVRRTWWPPPARPSAPSPGSPARAVLGRSAGAAGAPPDGRWSSWSASCRGSSPPRWPSCRVCRRPVRTRFPLERLSLPPLCVSCTYRAYGSARGRCGKVSSCAGWTRWEGA